jgi:mannose-1-phosphate guanylyltransferase
MNFRDLFNEHKVSGATLTISARKTIYTLPLGSLDIDSTGRILDFQEKPKLEFMDNIGVYIYSKRALDFIDRDEKLDVNVLTRRLLDAGEKVAAFREDGPYFWIDIGTHADYEKANAEFSNIKDNFPFLVEG